MKTLLAAFLLLAGCDASVISRGDRGEPGPAGQEGKRGPRGLQGPGFELEVYIVEGSAPVTSSEDMTIAQAYCDEGDMVLTGGCQWGDLRGAGDHYAEVRPYLAGPIGHQDGQDGFSGWQCHGLGMGEATSVYVTATCVVR